MNLEDEIREALAHRAGSVRVSVDEGWDRVRATGQEPAARTRLLAAVVAVMVFAGACLFLLMALRSTPTVPAQPTPSPATSAAGIAAALHQAGLGCNRLEPSPGFPMNGVDEGICRVQNASVTIQAFHSPEGISALRQEESVPVPHGAVQVRGNDWIVIANNGLVASAIRSVIGGTIAVPEPKVPTCAPHSQPWASDACPESVWLRKVVAAAGATIYGSTQGIEPEKDSAFLVAFDGAHFALSAVSKVNMKRMGDYFSMGEFSAGMPLAGEVDGITLAGDQGTGHWSWDIHGFSVEIYPAENGSPIDQHVARSIVAQLVAASKSVT